MIRIIDIAPSKPKPVVRTANDVAPLDCGMSQVTRAEYEALLARLEALEAVTRNASPVTHVAGSNVTRNASNADRQRRYRERKRQSGG